MAEKNTAIIFTSLHIKISFAIPFTIFASSDKSISKIPNRFDFFIIIAVLCAQFQNDGVTAK